MSDWNETIQSDEFKALSRKTPTTDRDELVASVIERFRWRVERKQFAPSVAEDLTLMMDRIQADAATIAGMNKAISQARRILLYPKNSEMDGNAKLTTEAVLAVNDLLYAASSVDSLADAKRAALKGGDHG